MVRAQGLGQVSGIISRQEDGTAVPGATVSWSGPVTGQIFTNAVGYYELGNLPLGEYTFTVSKIGFTSQQQTRVLGSTPITLNFQLGAISFRGLRGVTAVDLDQT